MCVFLRGRNSLRHAAGTHSEQLFFEHHAALHDEGDLLHHRNVGQRITLDCDDVGVLALLRACRCRSASASVPRRGWSRHAAPAPASCPT